MPRLSVVIPTYNRPEFLEGAIESAANQTYEDMEVIVVDDGSDEEYAVETVSQYPDDVRCVVHEQNRGLSAARNTGIAASDSKYVAFLDDDDRWQDDKLEQQVAALEDSEAAGLATCRTASIDADGNLLRCDGSVVNGDISDEIYTRNVIGTPSKVVVRRQAFSEQRPFDEGLPTKQDWDLYIRLCQEWEVRGVDEILCLRTRHGGMASDPEDAREDNMRVIKKHESEIRARDLWSETIGNYHEKVGVTYLLDGQRKPARRELRQSRGFEFSTERLAMELLTYATMSMFEGCLQTKRWFERRSRECSSDISWDRVYGM